MILTDGPGVAHQGERVVALASRESITRAVQLERADQAHRLSDYLGRDRDLLLLAGVVSRAGGAQRARKHHEAVLDLIARRSKQLQASAFHCGRRLFAASPAEFSRQLSPLWHASTSRRKPRSYHAD